jgi:hypothetical protein
LKRMPSLTTDRFGNFGSTGSPVVSPRCGYLKSQLCWVTWVTTLDAVSFHGRSGRPRNFEIDDRQAVGFTRKSDRVSEQSLFSVSVGLGLKFLDLGDWESCELGDCSCGEGRSLVPNPLRSP